MRGGFRLALSLALLLPITQQGQDSSAVDSMPGRYQLHLQAGIGLESNVLSSSEMYGLSSGQIGEAQKLSLIESAGNRLNAGYQQEMAIKFQSLGRHDSDYTAQWSIGIFNRAFTSISVPGEAFALALRGNKPFAGELLSLEDGHYQDWYYSGVSFGFSLGQYRGLLSQMGLSLLLGHSHQQLDISRAEIFTEEEGRYIDFAGDYHWQQGSERGSNGIAGIGLAIDYRGEYRHGKHSWALSVNDLGLMYWSRGRQLQLDSAFRFEGIFINNLFAIDQDQIDDDLEEWERALLELHSEPYWNITPFRAQFRYENDLAATGWTSWYAYARYRHLPGYRPRAGVGINYAFSEASALSGELGYGGFNALILGLSYMQTWGSHWHTGLGITNLPGVAAPGLGRGTYISGSLRYDL